jgi:hypothetical protein
MEEAARRHVALRRGRGKRAAAVTRAISRILALAASIGCSDGVTTARDAVYAAPLNGANERPPRSTGASGMATFRVTGDRADYEVTAAGLTGPPLVAHLLIGPREATAGQVIVRLTLAAPSGTIAAGTIDLGHAITFNNTTISGDSLRVLFENGGTFVNVYTAAFPGGEIRGQVQRQ